MDSALFLAALLSSSLTISTLAGAAEPLFRSGFNPQTALEPAEKSGLCIVGADTACGANWSALGGKDSAITSLRGKAFVNTGDEAPRHAGAEIVTTFPASPANPALRLWVADDDPSTPWVTRSCIRFDYRYGRREQPDFAFRKCHMRYKMFLAPEYAQHLRDVPSEWFQLFEIWDCGHEWKQSELSLNVRVVNNGPAFNLEFSKRIKGTDGKFSGLQRVKRGSFSLPFGRWVGVEFFYNPGFGGEKGRFLWRMDGTTVFDISAGDVVDGRPISLHENKPIMDIQPCKIYQADALLDRMRNAGTPCQAWYDDLEYLGGYAPLIPRLLRRSPASMRLCVYAWCFRSLGSLQQGVKLGSGPKSRQFWPLEKS